MNVHRKDNTHPRALCTTMEPPDYLVERTMHTQTYKPRKSRCTDAVNNQNLYSWEALNALDPTFLRPIKQDTLRSDIPSRVMRRNLVTFDSEPGPATATTNLCTQPYMPWKSRCTDTINNVNLYSGENLNTLNPVFLKPIEQHTSQSDIPFHAMRRSPVTSNTEPDLSTATTNLCSARAPFTASASHDIDEHVPPVTSRVAFMPHLSSKVAMPSLTPCESDTSAKVTVYGHNTLTIWEFATAYNNRRTLPVHLSDMTRTRPQSPQLPHDPVNTKLPAIHDETCSTTAAIQYARSLITEPQSATHRVSTQPVDRWIR